MHCCSLPHQGQARGKTLQYCIALVNMETTQASWDSMMAATTLFACCMLLAMCCLESKMGWPYREDARCPRQIQINYQIWECLMEPSPHSRPCWGTVLLTHSTKVSEVSLWLISHRKTSEKRDGSSLTQVSEWHRMPKYWGVKPVPSSH